MASDKDWTELARQMAHVLLRFARERRDEDRKMIAQLQTEMCKQLRDEIKAEKLTMLLF